MTENTSPQLILIGANIPIVEPVEQKSQHKYVEFQIERNSTVAYLKECICTLINEHDSYYDGISKPENLTLFTTHQHKSFFENDLNKVSDIKSMLRVYDSQVKKKNEVYHLAMREGMKVIEFREQQKERVMAARVKAKESLLKEKRSV